MTKVDSFQSKSRFRCAFASLVLLLVCSLIADAQETEQTQRDIVIFGDGNGDIISLLLLFRAKNYAVTFVFDGEYHYDSSFLLTRFAHRVISCPNFHTDISSCEELVAYASESKPLELIIDLNSKSAAHVRAIYNMFEANRKPRLYAALSSQHVYLACHDTTSALELSESQCTPEDDAAVPLSAGAHPFDYELGRQKLEVERELQYLLQNRGLSYLVLRAAPLYAARETVTTITIGDKQVKYSRMLTWILLVGTAAHQNIALRVPTAFRDFELSVLYTGDLTRAAMAIDMLGSLPPLAFSRTYNLASNRLTLESFASMILSKFSQANLKFEYVDASELNEASKMVLFPRSQVKPMDTSAYVQDLHMEFIELDATMKDVAEFYSQTLASYDPDVEQAAQNQVISSAIDILVESGLVTREQIHQFIGALRQRAQEATAAAAAATTTQAPSESETSDAVEAESVTRTEL